MRLTILAIACMLVVGLGRSTADGQNYRTADGHDFSVSLKVDKPEIMLGETTFLSFEIKNLSDTRLAFGDGGDYRNNLGRPESYRVTVVSDDGRSVPQPEVTMSMGGLYGMQTVPVDGKYVRRLFVPHWATFDMPGIYTVTVTRRLGISGKEPSLKESFGGATPSVTTKATASLIVTATDFDRLGAVIRETGMRMLSAGKGARESLQLLEFIKDERTIEYWIKAVRLYSTDEKAGVFQNFEGSPRILATYDAPEAWAELGSSMKSKSENVRRDVADALSFSPNERALPLLLTMQDDPNFIVRLRVAQRLDKEKDAAATNLLLKLLKDENQDVWETAERLLVARDKMPKDLPLRPLSALKCSVRQVKAVKTMQTVGGGASGTAGSAGIFRGGITCDVVLKAFQAELSEQDAANNAFGAAWVRYQIGDIYRDSRRYQQARENYERALPLFRELNNPEAELEVLSDLTSVCESLNNYVDAIKYLDQELALVRNSPNEYIRGRESGILGQIASSYAGLGNYIKAIDFLVSRVDWETKQKSEYGQFFALKELGKGYEKIGKNAEALASYERALPFLRSISKYWRDDKEINQLTADIQRLK